MMRPSARGICGGGSQITQPESVHFRIALDGAIIKPGKISFRDLKEVSEIVQAGVERVARVLLGDPGISPGPLPKQISQATDLLLTGIDAGSAVLVGEMVPLPGEGADAQLFTSVQSLGPTALDVFVRGLHQLETQSAADVPGGWDNAVMEMAQKLGEFSANRQVGVTLVAASGTSTEQTARILPDSEQRFRVRHAPIRRPRTQRGVLIMVDLGKGRVDVETEDKRRTQCTFPPHLKPQVEQLIGRMVDAAGNEEYDAALSKAGKLEILSIDLTFRQGRLDEEFWQDASAKQLAEQQNVKPFSFDGVDSGEFTAEDIEALLTDIRSARGDE